VARISQVVVLAEDERHQRLIYRYLQRLNYSLRDIRFEPLPSGRGCGEQWVRERYANSVRAYRARSAHANTALIVAIDADTGNLFRRMRQLENSLSGGELPPRSTEERIVHLIPRRNIETWILNLNGSPVDEETDFRHAPGIDGQVVTAALALYLWARPGAVIPQHSVPSLRRAIPEIRRLELAQ